MGYYDQLLGGGMPMMGAQPSASAFTSPGMPPNTLAMLLAMQNRAMSPGQIPAGPPTPPAPPGAAQSNVTAPQVPGIQQPPPQNILQMLAQLSALGGQNGLRSLFGGMLNGGGATPPSTVPNMSGSGSY